MISKWNYLPLTSDERIAMEQLAAQFPNCPAIARLLVLRGLKDADAVHDFLYPSLNNCTIRS